MMTVPPEVEGRLVVSFRHLEHYSSGGLEYIKDEARRRMGEQLIEALYTPGVGQMFTIRVSDEFEHATSEYSLWADITKVEEISHPTIQVPQYQSMGWAALSTSALDEIKRRVRGKVKRIFHRK